MIENEISFDGENVKMSKEFFLNIMKQVQKYNEINSSDEQDIMSSNPCCAVWRKEVEDAGGQVRHKNNLLYKKRYRGGLWDVNKGLCFAQYLANEGSGGEKWDFGKDVCDREDWNEWKDGPGA
ncbi:hypothetical protein [Peribacillus phoenicis]|uniref:hypothetical protein n=1 Tax=unclassified Peribacillus TaxID=2675266 RepID=UPI0039A1F952